MEAFPTVRPRDRRWRWSPARRGASGARRRSRWPTRAPTSHWGCATSAPVAISPDEIEALGRRALLLQMDVTDLAQVSSAVDEAVAQFGRIDILVNNAGLAPRTRPSM